MAANRVSLNEAEWQRQVTELAEILGWSWMHVRPAMKQAGAWRTPMAGPLGKGWPDLVLVRNGTLILAELKAARTPLTADQRRVLDVLRFAARVEIWRPEDFELVHEVLRTA